MTPKLRKSKIPASLGPTSHPTLSVNHELRPLEEHQRVNSSKPVKDFLACHRELGVLLKGEYRHPWERALKYAREDKK